MSIEREITRDLLYRPGYELDPFSVRVLGVERTLCEKIMGLVRAGYEANPAQEFRRRVRHFYDFAMILRVSRTGSSWLATRLST